MPDTMQETWERFGGEAYDRLAAELAATDQEWADLEAVYGPGGSWDARRKAYRSGYAILLRDQARERGEKVTEAMIEERAAAHAAVLSWLAASELEKARHSLLGAQREAITERIRHLRAVMFASSAEARLG